MKMFVVLALAAVAVAEPEADADPALYYSGSYANYPYSRLSYPYMNYPRTYMNYPNFPFARTYSRPHIYNSQIKPVVEAPALVETRYQNPQVYTAHASPLGLALGLPEYVARSGPVEHVVDRLHKREAVSEAEPEADPQQVFYSGLSEGRPILSEVRQPFTSNFQKQIVRTPAATYAADHIVTNAAPVVSQPFVNQAKPIVTYAQQAPVVSYAQEQVFPYAQKPVVSYAQEQIVSYAQKPIASYAQEQIVPYTQEQIVPYTQEQIVPYPQVQEQILPYTQEQFLSFAQKPVVSYNQVPEQTYVAASVVPTQAFQNADQFSNPIISTLRHVVQKREAEAEPKAEPEADPALLLRRIQTTQHIPIAAAPALTYKSAPVVTYGSSPALIHNAAPGVIRAVDQRVIHEVAQPIIHTAPQSVIRNIAPAITYKADPIVTYASSPVLNQAVIHEVAPEIAYKTAPVITQATAPRITYAAESYPEVYEARQVVAASPLAYPHAVVKTPFGETHSSNVGLCYNNEGIQVSC